LPGSRLRASPEASACRSNASAKTKPPGINSTTRAHSLFLVHPDGTGLKAITDPAAGGVCCAVWSPDSAWLLFPFKGLAIMSTDGKELGHISSTSGNYHGYVWGPSRRVMVQDPRGW
jgi:hypothetical protein